MEIRISIDTAEPLRGTAEANGAAPRRFDGWLELLHVISGLVGAERTRTGADDEPGRSGQAAPRTPRE